MAALRLPRDDAAPLTFAALAVLWREGLATPHDAGCGCGGMMMPALDAQTIEEDFLDYLHARYTAARQMALAAFLDQRRASTDDAKPPFEEWIADLAETPLSDEDRTRLGDDIRTFLISLGDAGRRVGICY
jgi:hypothetical protein